VAASLREEINQGRGDALPSERDLSRQLQVSRRTFG
jgi:DNA-binding GntR family transcriptional regulator